MTIKQIIVTKDFSIQGVQSTVNALCKKFPVEDVDVLVSETKVGAEMKQCFIAVTKVGTVDEVS